MGRHIGFMLGILLSGCSGEDAGAPQVGSCASVDTERCLVTQQRCELAGAAPRCVSCPSGEYAASDGSGCAPIGGTVLEHQFTGHTTQPGEEIKGQCRSWTLNNDTELWINAVELEQDELSHHSNWTFVPEADYAGPDGLWTCKDRDYDQLSAALKGGVLYAQSTQATREVQKFPNGVAIRIPARARVISDVHLLNVTAQAVSGSMTVRLHAIPVNEVTVKLAPFHVSYDTLAIPPRKTSRFSGSCELASKFSSQGAAGFDMNVYYLLPHTHALGTRMFVHAEGGTLDGTSLVDVRGYDGEARGKRWDDPLRLSGGTGLRFGCEFDNPRDEEVNWGFGDQEMCEALGFAESPIAFESRISEVKADGADGDIERYTGACSSIAFKWDK